jgi:23S rRNA pseudouridine1911/1915/1917 synthase
VGDPRDGAFVCPGAERLDRALRAFRPGLSWRELRDLIARGKVAVEGRVATRPDERVPGGSRVAIDVARPRAAGAGDGTAPPAPRIVFCDAHVVVVDKPAGVDTVPFAPAGRTRAPVRPARQAGATLDALVARALGADVRCVHRLDRDTTGLLAFARTREAEGLLAHQLRRHTVHRRYLALVHGAPAAGTLRSFLGDDRGDGRRGSVANRKLGKEAITHVEVVEQLAAAALVSCRLETGRTHQIRIHLAEAGHMVLGERAYTRDHVGPALEAPRILLHAAELGFVHPHSGERVLFAAPLPEDMERALAALR